MLRRTISVGLVAFAVAMGGCASSEPAIGEGAPFGAVAAASQPKLSTTIPPAETPAVEAAPPTEGVVVVPPGGAPLLLSPDGEELVRVHEGIAMGFGARSGEWLEVVTTCNDTAWVQEDAVEVTAQATRGVPGPGFDLTQAVIVLDPGHGDRDWGGVGPNGLAEKAVNLDIAERVRTLMSTSHDVDWATGDIQSGSAVPPFGTVWLTRDRSGPNGGDFELGLAFRAEFANSAGADAYVSIHNNTVPKITTDIPGTEVFYAVGAEDSDRLASLIYEEMLRSFSGFSANWTGGELLGARARVDPDTGEDYYGVLRRAEMPAVIVEGIYISEPEEEALLDTEEFRQAYADGVYRGIVRFLTTTEEGTGIRDPEPFPDDAGTVDSSACQIPAQP